MNHIPGPDASVGNGVRVDLYRAEGYVPANRSRADAQRVFGAARGVRETIGSPEQKQRAAALAGRF
jgi:hypothetical protein